MLCVVLTRNGKALYVDVAETLCDHVISTFMPDTKPFGFDICEMVIDKPLIAKGGTQLFRASAVVEWEKQQAKVKLFSVNSAGGKTVSHAQCTVRFGDPASWCSEWQRQAYWVDHCIERLQKSLEHGGSHKIKRGIVYKLFDAMVQYDSRFKGIEEVIFDCKEHEATGLVNFQADQGSFRRNPFWIDSLGSLSGFVLNGNEGVDSKSRVFLNHGWDSLRFATRLCREKTYRTYVKMQPINETMWAGDVYMFEEGNVVGLWAGVKVRNISLNERLNSNGSQFQGVPRRVLDTLLPPKDLTKTSNAQPLYVESGVGTAKEYHSTSGPVLESHAGRPNTVQSDPTRLVERALAIITEEIGISPKELLDEKAFVDYGVDSLLSLAIAGRYREDLNIDAEATIFDNFPTVAEMKSFLQSQTEVSLANLNDTSSQGLSETESPSSDASGDKQISDYTPTDLSISLDRGSFDLQFSDGTQSFRKQTLDKPIPKATSVILQGKSWLATQILHLLPDGSGSAASYANLTHIHDSVYVYGLNCPYRTLPSQLNCTLEELTTVYLAEIRRRQPEGPYNIGGWSAGGVLAFDIALRLLQDGEVVNNLILLDSPFPNGLEKLPKRMFDFFERSACFGPAKPPSWLFPHFLAFIDCLSRYEAVPLPPNHIKTSVLWAGDGMAMHQGDMRPESKAGEEDTKEMKWFLEGRKDFGPNGWDKLIGGRELVVEKLDGRNHFTMMQGDAARKVADFIYRAIV